MRGETNVAPETRDRIQAIALRLGYRPNLAARSLRSRRSHEVVLIAWSATVFNDAAEIYLQRIQGLEQRLREAGLPLQIHVVSAMENDAKQMPEEDLLSELELRQPIGVAMFSHRPSTIASCCDRLLGAGIPVVVIDHVAADEDESYMHISIDRPEAVRLAVHFLAERAYQRIAYVGPAQVPTRLDGYHKGMRELGREPLHLYTEVGHTSPRYFEIGRAAAAALATMTPRPDAVQCYSDALAVGLLDGLRALGLKVPEDVAVVGFDDRMIAQLCTPQLTTLAQPSFEVGLAAADALLSSIHHEAAKDRIHARRIVPRLVVRGSA